jgi:hypothetical protein
MSDNPKDILESLEPLFCDARSKGLIFRSKYQGLLFTPDELEEEHRAGKFIWGPANWDLVDPQDIIDSKVDNIVKAAEELKTFKKRLGGV